MTVPRVEPEGQHLPPYWRAKFDRLQAAVDRRDTAAADLVLDEIAADGHPGMADDLMDRFMSRDMLPPPDCEAAAYLTDPGPCTPGLNWLPVTYWRSDGRDIEACSAHAERIKADPFT